MTGFLQREIGFGDLDGWAGDDHAAALRVFLASAAHLDGTDRGRIAEAARGRPPRQVFETCFRPVLTTGDTPPLLTGYFEPELDAARAPDDRFRYAIHRPPDGAAPTRAEIMAGALDGRGLELAWTDDPVALYFLHVQGSGRLRLTDGSTLRIGFAGRNGHPYTSVGTLLVDRGVFTAETVTADGVRDWLTAHPDEAAEVMAANASYIFFADLPGLADSDGPRGTLGLPVTPGRSLAIDPAAIPLGAPVWVEADTPDPIRRLAVAQDTGSAIRGAQRADLFVGTGAEAGLRAGRINHSCRLVTLLPKAAP